MLIHDIAEQPGQRVIYSPAIRIIPGIDRIQDAKDLRQIGSVICTLVALRSEFTDRHLRDVPAHLLEEARY